MINLGLEAGIRYRVTEVRNGDVRPGPDATLPARVELTLAPRDVSLVVLER